MSFVASVAVRELTLKGPGHRKVQEDVAQVLTDWALGASCLVAQSRKSTWGRARPAEFELEVGSIMPDRVVWYAWGRVWPGWEWRDVGGNFRKQMSR